MTDRTDPHSSGEYSGVVEEAVYGVSSKHAQFTQVLSSGNSTREDRNRRKAIKAAKQEKKTKETKQSKTASKSSK